MNLFSVMVRNRVLYNIIMFVIPQTRQDNEPVLCDGEEQSIIQYNHVCHSSDETRQ